MLLPPIYQYHFENDDSGKPSMNEFEGAILEKFFLRSMPVKHIGAWNIGGFDTEVLREVN